MLVCEKHMQPFTRTLLADQLVKYRAAADISLGILADRAGVSKTYLWELEQDRAGKKRPSAATLVSVAEALGVGLCELIGMPCKHGERTTGNG